LKLIDIARLSEDLTAASGRNTKVDLLARAFRGISPLSASIAAAWLGGAPRQARLGLGPAAIANALGSTAPGSGEILDLETVDLRLTAIENTNGAGSKQLKIQLLLELLASMNALEQAFFLRLLSSSLRQGALDGLLIAGLARAFTVPEPALRRAIMLAGSLPDIALSLATSGPDALAHYGLTLFRPVQPMLADTAPDLEDLAEDLPSMLLEAKLDGVRIQAHKRGDDIRLYTRALNDITDSLPEVVADLRTLRATDAILDGEVLALRDGRPLPFQTTMRRVGRRHDIAAQTQELPLSTFLFDVLKIETTDLLDTPLRERRDLLERLCLDSPIRPTPALTRPDLPSAKTFLASTLDRGHEGLMLKRLDSAYEAGHRGSNWLKLKPAKTLDLVVIAVERGSGRRSHWLSNLHLAARDPELGFVMLGKTFKGLTDDLLEWQTRELSARTLSTDGPIVHVRPELVVEIAFQELESSPRYPGGLALRFARVRGYRPDKRPEHADTLETVRSIFERQQGPRDAS
jgi:DNA ligase-1